MKTRKNINCKSKKKYLVKNARTFKKQNNKYMSKRTHIYVGGSNNNVALSLFYPNIKLDDDKLKLRQPPHPDLIETLKKYIKKLICSNNIYVELELELELLFNMCVNYLFTYFKNTELPYDTKQIYDLFIKLITINYNAYTDNKKNLLLPKSDKHIYNLLHLHGGIENNKPNIFFQLPKNVTIIFLSRLNYLQCTNNPFMRNFILSEKYSIEKYIAFLNIKDKEMHDKDNDKQYMIDMLSIFKDAIFYYGEQYCIDLILVKYKGSDNQCSKGISDHQRGLGIYNSKSDNTGNDKIETYNTTLQKILQTDAYKDININHTIILSSCRPLISENMKYSNILKFYEEITQAINNKDNFSNVFDIGIASDIIINNTPSVSNLRLFNNQSIKLIQGFNKTKSNIPLNSKTFNTTSLFQNLTQKKITENTIIIIKNSDTGKDDIITIEALRTKYKEKLGKGDQPNYDEAFTYLNTIIPLPDRQRGVHISLLYKQYTILIKLIFNNDLILFEKFNNFLNCIIYDNDQLRYIIKNFIKNPSQFINTPINKWDVSRVTNMDKLFHSCQHFNEDISNWNVSNVISMIGMFYWCTSFTGIGLNMWGTKVSNVKNMSYMFSNCPNFNQDLNTWDVRNVEDMSNMFYYCLQFDNNKNILLWNTKINEKNKINENMFSGCKKIKTDLIYPEPESEQIKRHKSSINPSHLTAYLLPQFTRLKKI